MSNTKASRQRLPFIQTTIVINDLMSALSRVWQCEHLRLKDAVGSSKVLRIDLPLFCPKIACLMMKDQSAGGTKFAKSMFVIGFGGRVFYLWCHLAVFAATCLSVTCNMLHIFIAPDKRFARPACILHTAKWIFCRNHDFKRGWECLFLRQCWAAKGPFSSRTCKDEDEGEFGNEGARTGYYIGTRSRCFESTDHHGWWVTRYQNRRCVCFGFPQAIHLMATARPCRFFWKSKGLQK